LLAGGLGMRLNEETEIHPKLMLEIRDNSTLGHIVKHYVQWFLVMFAGTLRDKYMI
jgi:NDP-sugar pyrophosphorylase family protein